MHCHAVKCDIRELQLYLQGSRPQATLLTCGLQTTTIFFNFPLLPSSPLLCEKGISQQDLFFHTAYCNSQLLPTILLRFENINSIERQHSTSSRLACFLAIAPNFICLCRSCFETFASGLKKIRHLTLWFHHFPAIKQVASCCDNAESNEVSRSFIFVDFAAAWLRCGLQHASHLPNVRR